MFNKLAQNYAAMPWSELGSYLCLAVLTTVLAVYLQHKLEKRMWTLPIRPKVCEYLTYPMILGFNFLIWSDLSMLGRLGSVEFFICCLLVSLCFGICLFFTTAILIACWHRKFISAVGILTTCGSILCIMADFIWRKRFPGLACEIGLINFGLIVSLLMVCFTTNSKYYRPAAIKKFVQLCVVITIGIVGLETTLLFPAFQEVRPDFVGIGAHTILAFFLIMILMAWIFIFRKSTWRKKAVQPPPTPSPQKSLFKWRKKISAWENYWLYSNVTLLESARSNGPTVGDKEINMILKLVSWHNSRRFIPVPRSSFPGIDFFWYNGQETILGKIHTKERPCTFQDMQNIWEMKNQLHADRAFIIAYDPLEPSAKAFLQAHAPVFFYIGHQDYYNWMASFPWIFVIYFLTMFEHVAEPRFFTNLGNIVNIIGIPVGILLCAYLLKELSFPLRHRFIQKKVAKKLANLLRPQGISTLKESSPKNTQHHFNKYLLPKIITYFENQNFQVIAARQFWEQKFDLALIKDQQLTIFKFVPDMVDQLLVQDLVKQKELHAAEQIMILAPRGLTPEAQAFIEGKGKDFQILDVDNLLSTSKSPSAANVRPSAA